MKVKDLKAAEYNPRKIADEKLKALAAAMREFGDLSGIVFNKRTGRLVGGHQRVKNLDPAWEIQKKASPDKLGTVATGFVITPEGRWTYREVDWPEKKEKMANLAANKHKGEWEDEKLKALLQELDLNSAEIDLVGFDKKEVDRITAALNQEKPEIEFSEELLESHNYVVLYFDNDVDWLQIQTILGLKTVKPLHAKKGFAVAGVGRVVKGAAAIEAIRKELKK